MRSLVADAGFLVALWNARDEHHDWAVAVSESYPPPWTVCEAAFAEADHLLNASGRATLRTAIRRGAILLTATLAEDTAAILDLLDKYADVPMSVADACVVRLSDILPETLVLTTDGDFKIYRRANRRVIPCLLPQ